ncbi:hypothetical protein COA01_34000 [Bacillus cereus]|uniref:hypothetical protein n=1 Tax=Bacillus cereus TaxID=1396 RepID=UPI000BFB7CA8|nr:hypothetical protein [Bacillus cereus]PGP12832.1 hypothetical protein COA01_34000 [Bacillus cereus]
MNIEEKHKFFNELGFFTLCNAAPALGRFLKDTIMISSPKTELVSMADIEKEIKDLVYTTVVFNGGEIGETHVFLTEKDAMCLAKYVIKQRLNSEKDVEEWDEFSINAVEEVMNILGGNMTEILTVVFGKGVIIDVPELKYGKDSVELYPKDEELVLNTFTMHLGTGEKIKMKEIAKASYYKELVNQLRNRV